MSVSRVKYIKQFFPVETADVDAANSIITITTASAHNLFTGIPVTVTSGASYDAHTADATVVDSTTFTVPCQKHIQNIDNYVVNGYLPGQTGPQNSHTITRGTSFGMVIQSYVHGDGGSAYDLEVSLDKDHWIPMANITHTTTDGDTGFLTITPGWAYMRANISYVGANTNLVIISGE